MNYGSSSAKALTEKDYHCRAEMRQPYAEHRRNMIKQRLCGVLIIAAVLFAVFFAEDMELALGIIPAGVYLIFTKKSILTF